MNKQERPTQRQKLLAVSAVVFQALGMLGHDLLLERVPEEDLVKWLSRLQEIDWQRNSQLWRERGVTQVGASGEIISNTKTTVDACHRVLREFVGIIPMINAS